MLFWTYMPICLLATILRSGWHNHILELNAFVGDKGVMMHEKWVSSVKFMSRFVVSYGPQEVIFSDSNTHAMRFHCLNPATCIPIHPFYFQLEWVFIYRKNLRVFYVWNWLLHSKYIQYTYFSSYSRYLKQYKMQR